MENVWHNNYIWTALAIHEAMGLPYVRSFRTESQKYLLHMLNGSGGINPFRVAMYQTPSVPCFPEGTDVTGGCASQTMTYGGQHAFSNFTELWNSLQSSWRNTNRFCVNKEDCDGSGNDDSDKQHGYSRLAYGGAALMLDGVSDSTNPTLTATRAWDWIRGNVRYQDDDGDNPMWRYSPPASSLITNVRTASSQVMFSAPDGNACRYTVNPSSTLDAGDTVITDLHGREQRIDVTGLAAGSVVRITCGVARVYHVLP